MALQLPGSVEEVLSQIGITIASIGPEEISAHCPFHADSHPSFSINIRSGLWICYQCTESGSLQMLVQKVGGKDIDPDRYLKEVRRETTRERVQKSKEEPEEPEPQLDPALVYARYLDFGKPPRWALERRRIDEEMADHFGLRWDKGWIIPIWDPEMEDPFTGIWGWQFKGIDYVSNYPRSVKKSHTLFGLHEIEDDTIALVESPLDVVRLGAVGVTAVSSFGAYVSKVQLRLLVEVAGRVIIALDNDVEGQRQTAKIYRYIGRNVSGTKVLDYPDGIKDPGEATDAQIMEMFR